MAPTYADVVCGRVGVVEITEAEWSPQITKAKTVSTRINPVNVLIEKYWDGSTTSSITDLFRSVKNDPVSTALISQYGLEAFTKEFIRVCKRINIFFDQRMQDELTVKSAASRLLMNRDLDRRYRQEGKQPQSLDVVFVLDLTFGSEARALGRAILPAVDGLLKLECPLDLRTAIVGYRDFDCASEKDRIVLLPFSKEIWPLRKFLMEVDIKSKGDTADDVLGAMKALSQLEWKSSHRVVIHVGSSPCHGKTFHNEQCYDLYPEGDPAQNDVVQIIQDLIALNISYTFLRVCWRTDIMLREFNRLAGNQVFFDYLKFRASTTASTIIQCVRACMEYRKIMPQG